MGRQEPGVQLCVQSIRHRLTSGRVAIRGGRFGGDDATDLVAYHPSNGTVWTGYNTGSSFSFLRTGRLSPVAGWSIVAGEFAGNSQFDVAAYNSE